MILNFNIKDLAASIVKEAVNVKGNTLVILIMIIVILALILYSIFNNKK